MEMIDLRLEKAAKLNFQTQCCVEKGNCEKHCVGLCHFYTVQKLAKSYLFWVVIKLSEKVI